MDEVFANDAHRSFNAPHLWLNFADEFPANLWLGPRIQPSISRANTRIDNNNICTTIYPLKIEALFWSTPCYLYEFRIWNHTQSNATLRILCKHNGTYKWQSVYVCVDNMIILMNINRTMCTSFSKWIWMHTHTNISSSLALRQGCLLMVMMVLLLYSSGGSGFIITLKQPFKHSSNESLYDCSKNLR